MRRSLSGSVFPLSEGKGMQVWSLRVATQVRRFFFHPLRGICSVYVAVSERLGRNALPLHGYTATAMSHGLDSPRVLAA